MNFLAREQIGLGQSALHDVYSKEKPRTADLVDYALLDTMHETKDIRYGKPYQSRAKEPSMYQLLTGGYVHPEVEVEIAKKREFPTSQMTEEELKEFQEALLRKEIAKGKWMTETRDNFRKFTDSPKQNTHYIGNELILPKRLANIYEGHYMTTYKRDFGDEEPEEGEKEDQEATPVEETKVQQRRPSKEVKSPARAKKPVSKSPSRDRGPKKKKKKDIKKWIYERNKAKYGKPMIDKSKLSKEERKELERLEHEISVSRWKPNTHLLSLHGKPIWHPYGQGNTKPAVGGVVYGQYLLTHNVNPHSGENCPQYQQVYESAHNKAFENGKKTLEPYRRLPESPKISKEEMEELKNRNPIMPDAPSKHLKRNVEQLDLMKEVCFASKHSTPAQSEIQISEPSQRNTPKARKPIQKSTERAPSQKPLTQVSKPKPRKESVPVRVQPQRSTDQQVAAQKVTTPTVRLNAKDRATKDIGGDSKKGTAFMKTMASTGKPFADKTNQVSGKLQRDLGVPETKEKSPTPSVPISKPALKHVPKSEEQEIKLRDDLEKEEEEYEEEEQIEEGDQDEAPEVSPTVFPVGFPF